MNSHKFNLGNTVKLNLLGPTVNFHVVRISGRWYGTCVYDIQSIAATTDKEFLLKDIPENALTKIETVSVN
jgi:hypothetical protein